MENETKISFDGWKRPRELLAPFRYFGQTVESPSSIPSRYCIGMESTCGLKFTSRTLSHMTTYSTNWTSYLVLLLQDVEPADNICFNNICESNIR